MSASVREDSIFWKRRLELLLGQDINYVTKYTHWRHIYHAMSSERSEDLNVLLFKLVRANEIDAVAVLIKGGADANSTFNEIITVTTKLLM